MRVDSSSPNFQSPSIIPWFDNLISEASMDVETNKTQRKQEFTTPELVHQLNRRLEELGTHIQVKVHDKTNTIMVVVMKDDTDEIIREVPSEKMLDIMYNLSNRVGVFIDQKL
ncbi:flagellar protein FlaG [Paenibacillus chitinolyticus]|uniref:flagellar protein FlaG n=1 Tax=Paenibacillus chitinolyticus TaxID=79263 RepID=UPI0036672AD8